MAESAYACRPYEHSSLLQRFSTSSGKAKGNASTNPANGTAIENAPVLFAKAALRALLNNTANGTKIESAPVLFAKVALRALKGEIWERTRFSTERESLHIPQPYCPPFSPM